MTQLEARQVKAIELDILSELDRVCREHQLSYALAYGTLIGALRHSGFIPWDDDIDVYMPRDDYEKLYDLWKQGALGEHYSLVSYRDRTSINSYCKLVDTRTRAVESFLDESAGTLGLWVDIFPLERVDITDPAVHRAAKKEHRLVWWKYIAASNPRYATSALRRVVKYMLYPITYFADLYAISRKQDDMARACHRSTVSNVDNERYVLLLDDVMDRNIIRPAELFPTRVASFEGREFAIPAQAENSCGTTTGTGRRFRLRIRDRPPTSAPLSGWASNPTPAERGTCPADADLLRRGVSDQLGVHTTELNAQRLGRCTHPEQTARPLGDACLARARLGDERQEELTHESVPAASILTVLLLVEQAQGRGLAHPHDHRACKERHEGTAAPLG